MTALCGAPVYSIAPLSRPAPHSRRQAAKERAHVGCHLPRRGPWPDRRDDSLRQISDPRLTEPKMFEPILGLIVAVLLGIYLVFALLNPERF
jgi:K+-transporting ATPase KdpF subunit